MPVSLLVLVRVDARHSVRLSARPMPVSMPVIVAVDARLSARLDVVLLVRV